MKLQIVFNDIKKEKIELYRKIEPNFLKMLRVTFFQLSYNEQYEYNLNGIKIIYKPFNNGKIFINDVIDLIEKDFFTMITSNEKLNSQLRKIFDYCNLNIEKDEDIIYKAINKYKFFRELDETKKDYIYNYISSGLGF